MTRDEVFNRIARQIGKQPIACNCEKCREMCQRTPCLGTPQDILALIDAGYADKVCYTEWAAGMVLGHINRPIPMVQIKSKGGRKKDGCCVFFHNGMCELHESGLKPTEGKLSHHEVSVRELRKENNLTYLVAIEWCKEENLDIIREIVNKVTEHLDKEYNMNMKEIKKNYAKLVAEIESAQMFDGRNRGVDLYQCKDCGFQFYTRYKDKGVTPFTIRCRNCDHGTVVHEKTITEQIASFMGVKVHNWVRPTFEQLLKLSDGTIEHVLNGGLMLEDELNEEFGDGVRNVTMDHLIEQNSGNNEND